MNDVILFVKQLKLCVLKKERREKFIFSTIYINSTTNLYWHILQMKELRPSDISHEVSGFLLYDIVNLFPSIFGRGVGVMRDSLINAQYPWCF